MTDSGYALRFLFLAVITTDALLKAISASTSLAESYRSKLEEVRLALLSLPRWQRLVVARRWQKFVRPARGWAHITGHRSSFSALSNKLRPASS